MPIIKFPVNGGDKRVSFENGMLHVRAGKMNSIATEMSSIAPNAGLLSHFNVFSKMTLTTKNTHRVTKMRVGGLQLVAPTGACGWNPIKGITTRAIDHEACELQHQSEMCIDDLAEKCLVDLVRYNASGKISVGGKFTPEMDAVLGMVQKLEIQGIAESARMLHSCGMQFKQVSGNFRLKDTLVDYEIDQYNRGANACIGYPQLLKEMSTTNALNHLDVQGVLTDDDCGMKYTGSVVDAIEKLKESAPSELQEIILQNGATDAISGETAYPICIVSSTVYTKLVKEYNDMCDQPLTKMNCLTREKISFSVTTGGVTTSHNVPAYYVHDLPVICDPYINSLDKYTNCTTHFMAITVSGVINFGDNFGTKEANQEQSVALYIEIDPTLKGGNKMYKQADMLTSTAISDPRYITACRNIQVEKADFSA